MVCEGTGIWRGIAETCCGITVNCCGFTESWCGAAPVKISKPSIWKIRFENYLESVPPVFQSEMMKEKILC